MFNLAKSRLGNYSIDEEEKEVFLELQKDDFNRILPMLPVNQQQKMLRKATPDITMEAAEKVIKFLNQEKLSNPYTLLQDDVYQNGGQLTTLDMSTKF